MSTAKRQQQQLTPEEYLAGERDGVERHEFLDGHVYAMGGASDWHGEVAGGFYASLARELPTSCDVFISDMKVKVVRGASITYYYPDVVVSCPRETADRYYRERPVLLIEVLSPTTERIDRSEKFDAYRTLSSLQEYVLAAQDMPKIEVFRRRTAWQCETYLPGSTFVLDSVGIDLAVDDIYRRLRY